MSDLRHRARARAVIVEDTRAAHAAALQEQVRSGALSQMNLELMAYCQDPLALLLLGEDCPCGVTGPNTTAFDLVVQADRQKRGSDCLRLNFTAWRLGLRRFHKDVVRLAVDTQEAQGERSTEEDVRYEVERVLTDWARNNPHGAAP